MLDYLRAKNIATRWNSSRTELASAQYSCQHSFDGNEHSFAKCPVGGSCVVRRQVLPCPGDSSSDAHRTQQHFERFTLFGNISSSLRIASEIIFVGRSHQSGSRDSGRRRDALLAGYE